MSEVLPETVVTDVSSAPYFPTSDWLERDSVEARDAGEECGPDARRSLVLLVPESADGDPLHFRQIRLINGIMRRRMIAQTANPATTIAATTAVSSGFVSPSKMVDLFVSSEGRV